MQHNCNVEKEKESDKEIDSKFRKRIRSRKKTLLSNKKNLDILRVHNNNNYNKNNNIIIIKITTIKNVNSMLEINAFVAMKKWYIEV